MKFTWILIISVIGSLDITFAQSFKEIKKEQKEKQKIQKLMAKDQQVQDYKKDGYELIGSTETLGMAVYYHRKNIKNDKYETIEITTQNCPNINLCRKKNLFDAQAEYAAKAKAFIKGKGVLTGKFDETNSSSPAEDRLYDAYERLVSGNVSGKLKSSFSLIKKEKKSYKLLTHYIIKKEDATKARQDAIRQAATETKLNIDQASTVSDYINQIPTTEDNNE